MDNDPRSLDRLCDVIQNFIRARKIARDKVLAVGVNISGRVNSQTGYSYSYFFVEEQPLTMLLEERLGTTVYIENDTRAATYGEYMYGDAHSEKTMLYINASWGLGLGMIIDGKIFYGKSGFSGEFGHFPLLDNEIICRCGKRGCLETGASGSAMHRVFWRNSRRDACRCFREIQKRRGDHAERYSGRAAEGGCAGHRDSGVGGAHASARPSRGLSTCSIRR